MKIGLIARCEHSRGLGVLLKNFYDHMPVERTLLVRMRQVIGTEMTDWYPGATEVRYDPVGECLPEDAVREWIAGLDVVYTAETPYDWRLPKWCIEAGVKLVVHGMPEFVAHGNPAYDRGFDHPDQWWWPTSWRLNHLPPGRVMRIPLNRREVKRPDDPRLHIVHVVGHRAVFDRNGTDVVIQAMRGVTVDVKLTIHSHEGPFEFSRNPRVEVVQVSEPVDDQWSMYEDQDVLLLPRRYGGLCMPALEAAACGLVVAMPECSPNEELAAVQVHCSTRRKYSLPGGQTPAYDTNPNSLAGTIKWLSRQLQNDQLRSLRSDQDALFHDWDTWRAKYIEAFQDLL